MSLGRKSNQPRLPTSSSEGPPPDPPPSLAGSGRRNSAPLPGISETASRLRTRRSTSGSRQDPFDDEHDFEEPPGIAAMEDLQQGLIVPGRAGGASSGVATRVGTSAAPFGRGNIIPSAGAAPAPRSRVPAALNALKKSTAPLKKAANVGGTRAGEASSSRRAGQQGGAQKYKGTPARATRYSLPVRTEKPVRTSKTTGKHVLLPSESQLAPLPCTAEAEEEESSSEESDEEEDEHADAEDEDAKLEVDQEKMDEEQAAEERRARIERREAAQRALEERRALKAAQRAARRPVAGGVAPHARAPPRVPKASGPAYYTFERLSPASRINTPLPRLTSYAIGTSLHIPTLIGFLRREHGVKPRLYDECAYVVYWKPLLPGFGRANVRSSPEPRSGSPGGESRREREMEAREESGYVGSYFAESREEGTEIDQDGYIQGGEGVETENERETERQRLLDQSGAEADETEGEGGRFEPSSPDTYRASRRQGHGNDDERSSGEATAVEIPSLGVNSAAEILPTSLEEEGMPPRERDGVDVAEDIISHSPGGDHGPQMRLDAGVGSPMDDEREAGDASRSFEIDSSNDRIDGLPSSSPPEISTMRPMGAEAQRARRPRKTRKVSGPNMASHNADSTPNMLTSRSILEALQVAELIILPYGVLVMYNFSAAEERSVIEDVLSSGCVRGALRQDDEETEAFHYCYDPTIPAPRIFNDFFTFRASNHLLKLSLAHAIAQSTKLSVFEESMQRTLELTSHIPKELASTGELKLKRREALRLTGRLFKLRVDVNLTSNVLDTPELFWSEASLKALYDAIRDYLEIDQRVENLNERLAVANDLLEIIHEHISNEAMSKITWIIIVLIVVACFVACGEISARMVLHARDVSRRAPSVLLENVPLSLPRIGAVSQAQAHFG